MSNLKLNSPKIKVATTDLKLNSPKIKAAAPENAPNSYGTGRRKNAVARVWLKPGTGQVTINSKSLEEYFHREFYKKSVIKPFVVTKTLGQYDVSCTLAGGGLSGQAGALLHGIARALDKLVPDFHKSLRSNGFLTRDSRVVERKKYGKHKARKSTQFSKR